MVVVDTSVFIDYFRGNENTTTHQLDSLLDTTLLILGDVVALEILQGLKSKKEEKLVQNAFKSLNKKSMLDHQLAVAYADMFRYLRTKGQTIRKSNDLVIAGYCIKNGFPLLQKDRDFEPFAKHFSLELL